VPGAAGSGVGQQLLDDHLRLLVFALAEVVVPDPALRVGEVQRGSVVVAERGPYPVVVVGRDRVVDPHLLYGAPDVTGVVLEPELGVCTPITTSPWPEYFADQAGR